MTFDEAKEIFLNRGYIKIINNKTKEENYVFDGDKWREACLKISTLLKDGELILKEN